MIFIVYPTKLPNFIKFMIMSTYKIRIKFEESSSISKSQTDWNCHKKK